MEITPRNILRHELIGLKVRVLESRVRSQVGIEGRVIDETMNTFTIELNDGRRVKVLKKDCTFLFTLPSGLLVKVEGKVLIGRPEDRLKRRVRYW
ncbi:MAG: ribonuclease P protein subunit [Thermoprotei archaeon]|nr:MAG: ribonuclease P protein subunit [Thermoprotei archaeon]